MSSKMKLSHQIPPLKTLILELKTNSKPPSLAYQALQSLDPAPFPNFIWGHTHSPCFCPTDEALGSSSMRRPFQTNGLPPCCLECSSMASFLLQFSFKGTSSDPDPSLLFSILIVRSCFSSLCSPARINKYFSACFSFIISFPHLILLLEMARTISTLLTTGNPVSGTQ